MGTLTAQVATAIRASEDVGAARRAARGLGVTIGMPDSLLAKAELAVTELGTNVLHHAQGAGEILIQPAAAHLGTGIDIVAVDSGPGIFDVPRALAGRAEVGSHQPALTVGMPHRRSLGCGLASARRLATEFDLYTQRRQGTVILARFLAEQRGARDGLDCGGVSVPIDGAGGNGDAWGAQFSDEGLSVLVIDGLGHGARAEVASQAGVQAFRESVCEGMEACLHRVHEAMRATRGGAGSLCRISKSDNTLWFAGVGNVEGRVFVPGQRARGLACRGGTLGMSLKLPKVVPVNHAWSDDAILVMHTDGIKRHFDFDAYPGLLAHDPVVIAAALYRDLTRGRDDATVVVVRGGGCA